MLFTKNLLSIINPRFKEESFIKRKWNEIRKNCKWECEYFWEKWLFTMTHLLMVALGAVFLFGAGFAVALGFYGDFSEIFTYVKFMPLWLNFIVSFGWVFTLVGISSTVFYLILIFRIPTTFLNKFCTRIEGGKNA